MSTKIYTAYRTLPGVDLWALIRDIRRKAEACAKAKLWELYPAVNQEPVTALRQIKENYCAQLESSERNEWDLSVQIAIWRAGRRCLMIPFSGSGYLRTTLDFMRRHPDLENYSYWNNSDRPKKISAQAWQARKKTWNAVFDGGGWDDHLVLDIVSYNGFHRVDPVWAPEYRNRVMKLRGKGR